MKFSKRSEYAIKAAVQLALSNTTRYRQARDIADSEGLPAKFLESILLAMRAAGFLESKVGVGGGYRLRVPADQFRVADLIAAMEQATEVIHERSPNPTPGELAMQAVSARLDHAFGEAIGGLTLADLIALTGAVPAVSVVKGSGGVHSVQGAGTA